ncbi:MAG TPA: nucleotide exchange factor GrpE [Pyrinomonadaceae bacterium]|nr:nucleotide exchange factor GrpE [Pyrinomonadaceae bacterium]
MNEQEFNDEEILEGQTEDVPVNDKRRFDSEGERIGIDAGSEKSKEPMKSAREIDLETRLKAETERREAAESKLVGVQAKFEEIKTQMEIETAEMRRRLMKTLEDRARQGQFNFLTTLLPILDNLNLAINASEQNASFENLLSGVKGTARSFEQALISVGVEPVAAVGAEFNPELHEAIDALEVAPDKDGHVTTEYSRGYKLGSQLLRPARVQVGKAEAKSAGE